MIDAQINTHAAEINSLKNELRHYETQGNIIKAQIGELEAETKKQQAAGKGRQLLLDEMSERIANNNPILDFKKPALNRVIKNNIEDANKILNGIGEPITENELKEQTILKAKGLGRAVYV